MFDVLTKGGIIMIPLLLCSVFSVAIFLERLVYFISIRSDAQDLLSDVKVALRQGRILDAMQVAKKVKSPIGSLVMAALSVAGKPADEIRNRIQDAGAVEIGKLERNLPYLETIVTITPLLGLLGTVIGIVRNFNILSMAQGLASTSALSGGIAEALIATASGLAVAIPSLLVHSILSARVDRYIGEMNRCSMELLDMMSARSDA